MITVTREFADRIAEVAQLLEADEVPDDVLHRLTALGAELVPGGTAAAVTIAMASGALIVAASDQRLEELHRLQFGDADGDDADGPVAETLRHNEPRRVGRHGGRTPLAGLLPGRRRGRIRQLPGAAAAHRPAAGRRPRALRAGAGRVPRRHARRRAARRRPGRRRRP
jgi:hypothetical protein